MTSSGYEDGGTYNRIATLSFAEREAMYKHITGYNFSNLQYNSMLLCEVQEPHDTCAAFSQRLIGASEAIYRLYIFYRAIDFPHVKALLLGQLHLCLWTDNASVIQVKVSSDIFFWLRWAWDKYTTLLGIMMGAALTLSAAVLPVAGVRLALEALGLDTTHIRIQQGLLILSAGTLVFTFTFMINRVWGLPEHILQKVKVVSASLIILAALFLLVCFPLRL